MKNRKKSIVIVVLLLIEVTSLFLMYKSSSAKETILDSVSLRQEIDNLELFAIMLEQEDGTYVESDSSSWPTDMMYNSEMSGCIDTNGNKLDGVLTFDSSSNTATVDTNSTSYCYLYFDAAPDDLNDLCGEYNSVNECITNNSGKIKYISDIWDSTLEDDGYRYVGTNPDNYICFGTDNQDDCKNDTDKYMYRIIGIFEDSDGKQHLKLIKKEALNTAYAWHSDYTTDTDWQDSDLYKGLNGDYFLNNTDLQDSSWNGLIETWNYTATNTKTYENYSTNSVYGPNYYSTTPVRAIYLHEMNRSSKSSATCYYNSSTTADCSVGVWDTVSAKIGLMYVSDYQLSLGETALDYTNNNSTHYASMKTGWMHITNNDSASLSTTAVAPPSSYEWTMSRYGAYSNGWFRAWYVYSYGYVNWYNVHYTNSVRPVFYLESDVGISGGDGSSSNPFILEI